MIEYLENFVGLVTTALIAIIAKKYIEPILPDRKKVIDSIKYILFFVLKYVLPICLIIYSTINDAFDKFYVLSMTWYFGILVFQFTNDFVRSNNNKLIDILTETIKDLEKKIEEAKSTKANNSSL